LDKQTSFSVDAIELMQK